MAERENKISMKRDLLGELRDGKALSVRQLLFLTIQLSVPAIMAQISSVIMQYIDASMVGHLGADESAAIGLVASSTWLMNGLYGAVSVGFTVQIAHAIGAGDELKARGIVRQGLMIALISGTALLLIGAGVHRRLPVWIGGNAEICGDASSYFLIYSLALPAAQLNNIAAGMLQCSGNMKVPSVLHVIMCGLDVVFNAIFIFPARKRKILNCVIKVPGMGLGVAGASLGTAVSVLTVSILMLYFLLVKSPALHLRREEHLKFSKEQLKTAAKIALPVGFEQTIMCGAQVIFTKIVSPLGTISIAANSFSVTAESLCYMPGYGIGAAATTLIGQSIGADRRDVTKKMAWLITGFGVMVMCGTGILMYIFAPQMIGMLSPNPQICALGVTVLRIEALAEPLYAASIVATGVFRGAGDTFGPSCLNFVSMWLVRLPLASFLSKQLGLEGVWIAMRIELYVRGILFLIRMWRKDLSEQMRQRQ